MASNLTIYQNLQFTRCFFALVGTTSVITTNSKIYNIITNIINNNNKNVELQTKKYIKYRIVTYIKRQFTVIQGNIVGLPQSTSMVEMRVNTWHTNCCKRI